MEELLVEIEKKRDDMLKTARNYGLKSEKTIELSQQLDELLNTYHNMHYNFTYIQQNAM